MGDVESLTQVVLMMKTKVATAKAISLQECRHYMDHKCMIPHCLFHKAFLTWINRIPDCVSVINARVTIQPHQANHAVTC